jgi:hypothetical protein
MAKYKTEKGFAVQTLSSDTAASEAATGSWASGENLPGQRYLAGSAGTVSSNLQAGGATQPPANSNQINTSIEFDGTNWTAGGTMNTTRFDIAGFGATNTAAIMAGGAASPGSAQKAVVESYNGSTFTEVADLNTARTGSMGVGISTAGLVVGGKDTPSNYTGNTESWNGSAWTEVNDLNSGRENAMSGGTSTAAIAAGGTYASSPYIYALTEQWDGSNWTEVSDLNTGRVHGGSSGSDYTDVLVFGGGPPNVTVTEFWNGSSWTEVADLSNGRHALGGSPAGSSSSAIAAGGNPSPYQYTELWTAPSTFTKINLGQVYFNSTSNAFKVTLLSAADGTWASGGTMNTARSGVDGGTGTQTAAMLGGGAQGPGAEAEQYNGSSWTEVADLNTPRGYIGGAGTTTAMVTFGGNSSPNAYTELWNGSAWSETADLNTGRQSMGACGATSTAALCISGASPSRVTNVESWNGSAWTEIADVNQKRYYTTGSGSQTDALLIAGQDPPVMANVEKWNGSSWTEVGDLNLARFALASSSNPSGSDNTLAFGGHTASPDADKTNTESWNGTSWTEVNDLSSAVAYHSGAGSSFSAALSFGGSSPSVTGASEEFTAATANSTITVS